MATVSASIGPNKAVTADDDTQEFIRGLEMSARKVLTRANKRRMEELRRQELLAKRLGSVKADLPNKFVLQVPPENRDWGDQLGSKTMEISSTGMTVAVRATCASTARHRLAEERNAGGAPLPALSGTNMLLGEIGETSSGGKGVSRTLPHISKSVGSLTFGVPPKIRAPPTGGRGRDTARTAAPATKIDGRLAASPLFSASMIELTKAPSSAAVANSLACDPLSGGGTDEEAAGGIANMRVVNAAKIVGKGGTGLLQQGAGARAHAQRRNGGARAAEAEAQGATSWSSDDLRVKYRAEREREEAYQAFRLEEQVAEALEKDYGQIVSVPEVDRHPLYVAYCSQLERENKRCLLRASARNKMKRFTIDVHTVWLTNLAHHPEHRTLDLSSGGSSTGTTAIDAQTVGSRGTDGANRKCLDGRRDSAAIAASKSQIQSVQPQRAFEKAVYFAVTPMNAAELPLSNNSTTTTTFRQSQADEPAGDSVGFNSAETDLVNSRYADIESEKGASPELPPTPDTAPTLVILASERPRIAPVSAAATTIGGRHMSVAGRMGSGGSVAQPSLCKRFIRIIRFTPSVATSIVRAGVLSNTSIISKSTATESTYVSSGEHHMVALDESQHIPHGGGDEGDYNHHPDTAVPAAVAASEVEAAASWMIASYNPFDGSESRVVLEEKVVVNAVRNAVSGVHPMSNAASVTEVGSVDPAVGIGGEREVQRRLVLRKAIRVPILGQNGIPVGSAASVVEVLTSSCREPRPKSVSSGVCRAGQQEKNEIRDNEGQSKAVMLEVVAYPMLPLHRQQQRGGRQRVVLTPESLWHRRRLIPRRISTPTAFDKPPRVGGLDSVCQEGVGPGATVGDGIAGLDARAGVGVERDGLIDGVGCGGKSSRGAVREDGNRENEKRKALDDLVGMVAFGSPPPTGECSDCSTLPLLLQPSQSFGSEVEPSTSSTRATLVVAAKRIDQKHRAAEARPVPGGAERLEHESTAEVLCSLVRLGSGRGRDLAINIEGVDPSALHEDAEQGLLQKWSEQSDSVEPLSMRVCGRRGHTREVPGTCNIGRMGVTFTYSQAVERTQAVAAYFRDSSISSSDSIIVVVAMALDTPRLTPEIIAWERGPAIPEPAPDEDILDVIPRIMIPPGLVLREGVISDIDGRSAPDALLLTAAEKYADHHPQMAPVATDSAIGRHGQGGAVVAGEDTQYWVRHRRDWQEVDRFGFRRYAVYRLLEPDKHIETLAFGVTKRAALPNTPAVCGRSTFHSEQRCTEQLCRQRTASDYSYVSANDRHRGACDPGNYSVSCKHERMIMLSRTGLERYNADMARIATEREKQAKDAALQAKVEIGKAQLANRRAREDAAARSLARKADNHSLTVSAYAGRARHKWELRMQDSHVRDTRGSWEQRQDSGGSVFYHCTDPLQPDPFSWDPPPLWDQPDPPPAAYSEEESTVSIVTDAEVPTCSNGGTLGNTGQADGSSIQLGSLGLSDGDPNPTIFPRHYTHEEKLDLAVSRLAENEDLLGALAWRLGIPREHVRPDGREPALARGAAARRDGDRDRGEKEEDEEEEEENREQVELGEFDDASDSDGERGDTREPPGPLPQDHTDLRRIRVARRRREMKEQQGFGYKQPQQPCVPSLPLGETSGVFVPPAGLPAAESLEAQLGGMGWRRLARDNLGRSFLERVTNPRTQAPTPEMVNTGPKARPSMTIDPTRASRRAEDFTVPVDTMFINDVVEEHARVLHEAERRRKREEMLEEDASQEFNAVQFLTNGPQEFTSIERRLVALAEHDGRSKDEVRGEEAKAKAMIATKAGNLPDLESLLCEDVPVDTKDSNGNTLLLLAAQQGNKRITKFLLRKGATMNDQNVDGNTVLHFCFASGNQVLGEYLKSKGADDSLLNAEGLTCYEGLTGQAVDDI